MELSETTILVGSNPNLVCVFRWRRDAYTHVSRIAALSFPARFNCARKQKGILAADTTRLRALLCSLHSVSYLSFGSALLDITRYLAHPFGTNDDTVVLYQSTLCSLHPCLAGTLCSPVPSRYFSFAKVSRRFVVAGAPLILSFLSDLPSLLLLPSAPFVICRQSLPSSRVHWALLQTTLFVLLRFDNFLAIGLAVLFPSLW